MAEERNFRKVRRGYVVSDAMDKTITVELEQRSTHPLYGKVVRSTRKVKNASGVAVVKHWYYTQAIVRMAQARRRALNL